MGFLDLPVCFRTILTTNVLRNLFVRTLLAIPSLTHSYVFVNGPPSLLTHVLCGWSLACNLNNSSLKITFSNFDKHFYNLRDILFYWGQNSLCLLLECLWCHKHCKAITGKRNFVLIVSAVISFVWSLKTPTNIPRRIILIFWIGKRTLKSIFFLFNNISNVNYHIVYWWLGWVSIEKSEHFTEVLLPVSI